MFTGEGNNLLNATLTYDSIDAPDIVAVSHNAILRNNLVTEVLNGIVAPIVVENNSDDDGDIVNQPPIESIVVNGSNKTNNRDDNVNFDSD